MAQNSLLNYILLLIIPIALYIVIKKIRKKQGVDTKITAISTPVLSLKVEEKEIRAHNIDRIAVLRSPTNIDSHPAKLNEVRVKVYDEQDEPIPGILVEVELLDSVNAVKRECISGQTSQITNDKGEAIFRDLLVSRSGSYQLCFLANSIQAKSRVFLVTPPGIDTNYMDKEYGESDYYDALTTAIEMNKGPDRVKVKGKEV